MKRASIITRLIPLLKRIARVEVLLLLASLLLVGTLAEIAARRAFLLPYNPGADGWWKVQWLKHSAQYSSEHALLVIDKHHPVLGWTLRENLRGVRLLDSTVNSNSQGIRGIREYPLEKGSNTRIVVIGDSYTFGEAVNDDETFAAGVERLVENSEVLNMGVHGYGTDQQLLRLRVDGLKYRPDFVLVGYYEDDVSRNQLSFRGYAKPRFSVVNGRLVATNLPIPSPEEYKARFHLRLASYVNIFLTAMRERQLAEENVERAKLIFDAIVADSRSIGATVIQVYLPTGDQVKAKETDHPGLYSYGCALDGVVCVDPTPAMHAVVARASDPARLFRYHYAPELNQAIAAEVARTISGLQRTLD